MASVPIHPRPLAPAVNNGQPTPPTDDATPSFSYTCLVCSRRKVKCDKTGPPCSTCRKAKLNCQYEAPAPRKRKRRPAEDEDVHGKLEHYERLLKQHGVLSTNESSRQTEPAQQSQSQTPASPPPLEDRRAFAERRGKLVAQHGKTRYIDSSLWRNLDEEELHHSGDDDDDEEAEQQPLGAQQRGPPLDPLSASLIGGSSVAVSLLQVHPSYDVALKLWKVFVSHVDPIIKILHVPSGLEMVQRAAANPSSASKSVESLLFAIYHFAVIAMTDAECTELVGQPRSQLQSRYYGAVTQALVNAHFLRTTELAVVQAYLLFLLSVRNRYDPHTFWILTGVAVRLAQRLGVHQDGAELGLKPFDVQMRRRLFWQLLPLDGNAAMMSGTGIAIPFDSWDTKLPLNVNDADLHPDMTEPPAERKGATDMMFCRVRAEVGRFHQKSNPVLGNWGRLWEAKDVSSAQTLQGAIDELENRLEEGYIRYCDSVTPIRLLTFMMARGTPIAARFRLRFPRHKDGKIKDIGDGKNRDFSEVERKELFDMALTILDYGVSALTTPILKRFSWHLHAFFQWDPLIWTLHELRLGMPTDEDARSAWSKIEQLYECHPRLQSAKRTLFFAIAKLTLRAWDARPESERARTGNVTPAFIEHIRMRTSKRNGSRSTEGGLLPLTSHWSPEDSVSDLPLADFTGAEGSSIDTTAMLDNLYPDNFDWMFWDQLIKDPDNLPRM